MTVHLLINFQVRQDKLASFNDLMATVKTALPGVAGCQGVRIYRDLAVPLSFTLVETWDSIDAHACHVQRLKADGQWEAIASHLSEDPVGHYHEAL